MLALRTVPVATGMTNAVLIATALALIEAVAVMSAAAITDGTDGLSVREWQIGKALEILWRKGIK